MKKIVIVCCLVAVLASVAPMTAEAAPKRDNPGGLPAFLVGCFFGIREGTEWNEGKNLHWREWVPLPIAIIPYVGGAASLVFHVWDAIQCGQGMTSHEFAEKYGTNWY